MTNEIPKIRIFKEKEKIQQVTHWDLDFISGNEVRELYEHESRVPAKRINRQPGSGMTNQVTPLVLIATGVFLLAVTILVTSLI